MKLFIMMLYIADGAAPQRVSFAEDESSFTTVRETANCWYLENPSHGLPERYRKENEYRLQNNKNGIYMFGKPVKHKGMEDLYESSSKILYTFR